MYSYLTRFSVSSLIPDSCSLAEVTQQVRVIGRNPGICSQGDRSGVVVTTRQFFWTGVGGVDERSQDPPSPRSPPLQSESVTPRLTTDKPDVSDEWRNLEERVETFTRTATTMVGVSGRYSSSLTHTTRIPRTLYESFTDNTNTALSGKGNRTGVEDKTGSTYPLHSTP